MFHTKSYCLFLFISSHLNIFLPGRLIIHNHKSLYKKNYRTIVKLSFYFLKLSKFMPLSRQLAAIMFTDIVGYTALMGDDEEKALNY